MMTAVAASGLHGKLNTPKIVLLVIAAAAPLAAVVGTVPLAFALGNGAGVPGMFVFAGLVLLCFSVGYAAMSRRIVHAGGFYPYLSLGLGRPAAIGGGLAAVVAYHAAAIGLLGAFGYFAQLTTAQLGLNLPWEAWAGLALIVVGVLGYRQIDLSARVLSLLMMAEIGILAVLDVAVIAHRGGQALPAVSMTPGAVFHGAVGVSMMFAFMSFIGFESAALYGEETGDPRRSVPLATYASVLVISVFYAITSWVAVGGIGASKVRETAATQLGSLFFTLSGHYASPVLTTIMQFFLCTSVLAAALALHNAANRYTFVLGREGVLPSWLGRAHPRHHSPSRASLAQSVLSLLVVGGFALAGLDPYTNLATSTLGLGTLGIVLLQAGAAVAVLCFFWRRADRHWWRTGLAPLLGAIGLVVTAVLLLINFPLLTGTGNPVVNALPWLLFVAVLCGVGYALWLRARYPHRYALLARAELRGDDDHPIARTDEPEQTTTVLR